MRIFIDTDCGVDDALAIAVITSNDDVDIVGITSTSGNTSAPQAASNVEVVLRAMGHHIPVTPGPEPYDSFSPRELHGPDGLAGYGGVPGRPARTDAATEMREFCEQAGPHDVLLCLGPLTNLAYARPTAHPRIVAVGGAGIIGEPDPGRDPNSDVDIAATTWVANNLSVDWVTINAGQRVWLEDIHFRPGTAAGQFLRAIHETYGWLCASRAGRKEWSPSVYDTLAVVAATDRRDVGWEPVSAIIDGTALWGDRGGTHRMLSAVGGSELIEPVRSAVAETVA